MVRPFQEDDVPFVAAIHVAWWEATYRGLVPDALVASFNAAHRGPQLLEQIRAKPQVRRAVLETFGLVRGFAAYGPPRDGEEDPERTEELYSIYIDPAFLGQGFGDLLLEHVLAEARVEGRQEVLVHVLENNQTARELYAGAGFALDGPPLPREVAGYELPHLRLRRKL